MTSGDVIVGSLFAIALFLFFRDLGSWCVCVCLCVHVCNIFWVISFLGDRIASTITKTLQPIFFFLSYLCCLSATWRICMGERERRIIDRHGNRGKGGRWGKGKGERDKKGEGLTETRSKKLNKRR